MAVFPHLGKFREFWCQKVLPLVYDDALSFYEVLCRMRDKLNEVITRQNEQGDYITTQLPILVDEYVSKYMNQNRSLPFIDCYAMGITEELDDISEKLNALTAEFGTSYAYYMRATKGSYKLNGIVNLAKGQILVCDGLIDMNFTGRINLQSECHLRIEGVHGLTDQCFLFGGRLDRPEFCDISLGDIQGLEDLFYQGFTWDKMRLDIEHYIGNNLCTKANFSASEITIHCFDPTASNVSCNFGPNLHGCIVKHWDTHRCNVGLGNACVYHSNTTPIKISTGERCRLYLNAAILDTTSLGGGSAVFAQLADGSQIKSQVGYFGYPYKTPIAPRAEWERMAGSSSTMPTWVDCKMLNIDADGSFRLPYNMVAWYGFDCVVTFANSITNANLITEAADGDKYLIYVAPEPISSGTRCEAGKTYWVRYMAANRYKMVYCLSDGKLLANNVPL